MRACLAGDKEGTYPVPYPALSRFIPLKTRDEAARTGLTYSAPLALVHCLVLRKNARAAVPEGGFSRPLRRKIHWASAPV